MEIQDNTIKNLLKNHRISSIFILFYVGINGIVYLLNGMKYPDNRDFTLITSWFNLSEDFSRIYASFYVGFAYNFISPLSIIVILEFASSGLYSWGNIYTVSVWYSFLLAIIATYLTSIYLLIYRHTSGSGTSIIAFSLSILLIFYLVIELIHIIKQAIGRTKSTQGFSYLERFLFVSYGIIFFVVFSYFMFFQNNVDSSLHVFGAIIFTFIFSFSIIGKLLLQYFRNIGKKHCNNLM